MEQIPAAPTANDEFRLGKLFHLTPLVDSELFLNSVFAPLCRPMAPVLTVSEREILLDRKRTWNTDYRFTDVGLVGDPRAKPIA